MKSVRDDFTGEEFDADNRIGMTITVSIGGQYYRADLDVSPKSFMEYIVKNTKTKNIPFGKYIKHKTEAETVEYNGRKGHYEPAKNVVSQIASLIEVPAE